MNDYQTSSGPQYAALHIANEPNIEHFQHYLKIHQQGRTDYYTFCKDCAITGIEKWIVRLKEMTCTYYDKAGNAVLEEQIPQ